MYIRGDPQVRSDRKVSGPSALLLGLNYCDVFYFTAGRNEEGFNNSASSQILSNAVEYHRPAARKSLLHKAL
jgi:hypothetical protein